MKSFVSLEYRNTSNELVFSRYYELVCNRKSGFVEVIFKDTTPGTSSKESVIMSFAIGDDEAAAKQTAAEKYGAFLGKLVFICGWDIVGAGAIADFDGFLVF